MPNWKAAFIPPEKVCHWYTNYSQNSVEFRRGAGTRACRVETRLDPLRAQHWPSPEASRRVSTRQTRVSAPRRLLILAGLLRRAPRKLNKKYAIAASRLQPSRV